MKLACLMLFCFAAVSAEPARWDGGYALASDGKEIVNAAVDRVVSGMNFLIRPIARKRLLKVNRPSERITLKANADALTVDYGESTPVSTPFSGQQGQWVTGDHETVQTKFARIGDDVEQIFTASDGVSEFRYHLEPDGKTLILKVTVTSSKLPTPLTYELKYLRSRPA